MPELNPRQFNDAEAHFFLAGGYQANSDEIRELPHPTDGVSYRRHLTDDHGGEYGGHLTLQDLKDEHHELHDDDEDDVGHVGHVHTS